MALYTLTVYTLTALYMMTALYTLTLYTLTALYTLTTLYTVWSNPTENNSMA